MDGGGGRSDEGDCPKRQPRGSRALALRRYAKGRGFFDIACFAALCLLSERREYLLPRRSMPMTMSVIHPSLRGVMLLTRSLQVLAVSPDEGVGVDVSYAERGAEKGRRL